MCSHEAIWICECKVCKKCGMTLLNDNRIYFDRKLPDYRPKMKGRKNEQKY